MSGKKDANAQRIPKPVINVPDNKLSSLNQKADGVKNSINEAQINAEKSGEPLSGGEIFGALDQAADGMIEGIENAITAFKQGDDFGGVAGIIDALGSAFGLIALAGPVGGLVAGVLSAVMSLISFILKMFSPPQKSLLQQIKELLEKMEAETIVNVLRGLLDSTQNVNVDATSTLDQGKKESWESLSTKYGIITGFEVSKMGEISAWLKQDQKQKLPYWNMVFDSWVQVINLQVFNYATIIAIVDDEGKINAADQICSQLERLQNTCNQLFTIAQNSGKVYHLATGSKYRQLYSNNHVVNLKGVDFTHIGGESDRVAVDNNERIWALEGKNNGKLWTRYSGNWKATDYRADEIFIRNTKQYTQVWAVNNEKREYYLGEWNESKKPKKTVPPTPDTIMKWVSWTTFKIPNAFSNEKFFQIVVTPDGIPILSSSNSIYLPWGLDPTGASHPKTVTGFHVPLSPKVSSLQGISISTRKLYLYTRTTIYYAALKEIQPKKTLTLTVLSTSSWKDKAELNHLFACSDETVIAVHENEKMYLYRPGIKQSEGEWSKDEAADTFRVYKTPLDSWDSFRVLAESNIDNLNKEIRKLRN